MNTSKLHTLEKLLSVGIDIPRDDEEESFDRHPIAGILIPRIQRPYAQGRSEKNIHDIRRDFVQHLLSALSSEEERIIELSFIFGSLQKVKWHSSRVVDQAFELLDGQQRLTTLFLLHWYLYKKESPQNLPEWLSHFRYETRDSSTAFLAKITCESNDIDLSDVLKSEDIQNPTAIKPSEAITRLKWFNNDFRCDTTVISMLCMLDEMDSQYKALEKSGKTLGGSLHKNLGRIQFYVRLLIGFDMPDLLFIKMNSRGLPLIPFENFKADALRYMEMTKGYKEQVKDGTVKYPEFNFYFASQIDTKWVYLFWVRPEFPSRGLTIELNDKRTGARFFRFFNRMLFTKLAIDFAESEDSAEKDDLRRFCEFFLTVPEVSMEQHLTDWNTQYVPAISRWRGDQDYFRQSAKILNILSDNYTSGVELRENIRKAPFLASSNFEVFSKIKEANGDYTYAHRAFLSVLIDFLLLIPDGEKLESPNVAGNLSRLIRVLHNVLEHTEVNKQNILEFLRAFHKILKTGNAVTGNFYVSLSNYDGEFTWIKAESAKAKDICRDENFEAVMIRGEEHPILRGRLTPIYESETMTTAELSKRVDEFYRIFPVDKDGICQGVADGFAEEDSHLLIRALLSYLTDWEKLNGTYITERGFIVRNGQRVNSQHLSNILFGKGKAEQLFQKYFAGYFENKDFESYLADIIKEAANIVIANDHIQDVYPRLITDLDSPKIYNWIKRRELDRQDREPDIIWRRDAVVLNYDRTSYDRLVLSTPRRHIIPEVIRLTSSELEDKNQVGHPEKFGEYFAYDVSIVKRILAKSGDKITIKAIFYPNGWCKTFIVSSSQEVHNALNADRNKNESFRLHFCKSIDSAQEIAKTINDWTSILE